MGGEQYERHFHLVYAYIAFHVGDRRRTEDLTADVFREALAGIGKLECGTALAARLLGIAARVLAQEPASAAAAGCERTALLFQLVEQLPEAQFRVIHLRFVEQKSIPEIAAELRRSEGAVKQLQFRAIESLRAHLEGHA